MLLETGLSSVALVTSLPSDFCGMKGGGFVVRALLSEAWREEYCNCTTEKGQCAS